MKNGIIIHGFKTTYEKSYDSDGKATGRKDRPVDWVTYSPAHAAMFTQISERVDWMRPPESIQGDDDGLKMAAMRHKWDQIERAYDAWKQGHAIPLDGTALGVWPGINEQQAQAFRAVGINTVEQVADIVDAMIVRVQLPGVRDLKKQAQAFLDATDRNSTASRLSDMEDKFAALQEQHEAALMLLEEQSKGKGKKSEKVEEAA